MAKDKIKGDMSIVEVVSKYPNTAPVFLKHGMHCIGCAAARFETLAEGAMAHGMDVDALLDDLNKVAEEQSKKKKE